MRKRILTMFWYDDAGEVHLYKDVGGIPYALAKYCGWQATFAYNDVNGIIHNDDYEKYVKLDTIHYPKILCKLKLRYYKYFQVIKYVWKNAPKYDVINFYHCHKFIRFLCWLAKKVNPAIITYVKLDMGREGFVREQNVSGGGEWGSVSLFTVEVNSYVDTLNKLAKFNKRVRYVPNGFFNDLVTIKRSNIKKERIILTVARFGVWQKNTELLLEAFKDVDANKLDGWQLWLVGPMTKKFLDYLDRYKQKNIDIASKIITFGNISSKKELYEIYAKAGIFVHPSKSEGFPLVIPEAMFYACYPIITDCFDAAREIINDERGKVIKNENKNELVDSLIWAIDNFEEAKLKGKYASVYAQENLIWEKLSKRIVKYFNDIK